MKEKEGYSKKDWDDFSTKRSYHDPNTKTEDIYKSRGLHDDLDPKKFEFRESIDSTNCPQSTPIIVGLDVTGSMNPILDSIARKGLKTICEGVYTRKPVTDPQICVLGIGDVETDRAPFQATQFEDDIRIFEQLEKLFLEGAGGGNNHESYILAWFFAIYMTKTDSFQKRGVKGTIFTMGDEEITPIILAGDLKNHLNQTMEKGFTPEELYDLIFPQWNVFHIILKEGSHARRAYNTVYKSWSDVIGDQHVIPLNDHTKAGEVIVSTLELLSGKTLTETVNSWDGSTGIAVADALKTVTSADVPTKSLDSVL